MLPRRGECDRYCPYHGKNELIIEPQLRTLMKKVRALDALKEAGNTAFKEQRTEEAIEKYSEAISFDEENETMRSILLSNRAAAYLRVRAISFSQSSPSLKFVLFVQLKQYDSAISDCTTCLSLNSSYFKALRTRARSYLAQEEFEDAVRDFKAAFELAPSGSNDESMLKKEVREAEQQLKKSKMKVCRTHFFSHLHSCEQREGTEERKS